MASNELVDFDYSYDYFNHTKFCPLCQNRKTLKVPLAFFHLDCRCKLTEEEKKPCNFSCTRCRWLNEVGVEKLYAQRCEIKQRRKTLFVTKIILQEFERARDQNDFKILKINVQKSIKRIFFKKKKLISLFYYIIYSIYNSFFLRFPFYKYV